MDKNENGSTAQFSPEELIRRLKSQLNISTEQEEKKETEAQDGEADTEALSEDTVDAVTDTEAISEESVVIDDGEDAYPDENVDTESGEDSLADYSSDTDTNAADEIYDTSADDQFTDYKDIIMETVDENSADEPTESDDGSTVEFSISSLFGGSDTTDASVKEIEPELGEKKEDAPADDFDFLSFLTASGISANNEKSDDEDTFEVNFAEPAVIDTQLDEPSEVSESVPELEHTALDEASLTSDDEIFDEASDADDDTRDAVELENSEYVTANEDQTPLSVSVAGSADAPVDEVSSDDISDKADATLESAVAEVAVNEDGALDYSFGEEPSVNDEADDGAKALPDFNMLIALGIPVAEVEKIYGADAAEEYARLTDGTDALTDLSDDEEEYEYTSRSQNEEIEAHYKSEKKLTFVKLFAAAVLFIFAVLFENLPALGAEYSGWMDQSAFPVVHIMVDLQLVLFAAVLAWDELVSGIKALLRRSANVGTVLAAAVLINVVCDIALCFTRVAKYEVKLAGASVIFAVLVSIGISALRLFAEIRAFAMISQSGTRTCVLTESVDDVRERNTFFDKLSKEEASSAKVLSFGKTGFVSDFFSNQNSDRATVIDKILAPAAIVGAIISFVIAYAVSKSVGIGLYTFNCAAAFLIPVSVFGAGTLTYARAASYAESMKAAIIGENSPYDLADSSVIAFEDRDAYPSYCVKLRNLKVYGNIAIVDVLRMTTTAFRKIGGPLSDVLESATAEVNKDIPVDIVKSSENGVEAMYQGQRLLIGKADFLHSYGIIPYSDVDDREYLKTGDVSIMYVAYGDELSAKFYIQYTLDVDFEVLLRDLNRAGICVSIRTSDPNIDKRLLQAKLNLNKTSLRIVYRAPADGRTEPADEASSAVIGTGTPSELVHTAMLCDRVVHVYRTNTIVKALSFVIGLALLVLFALISVNVNVFSGLLIIYQLFWMIPTLIVSKLFL